MSAMPKTRRTIAEIEAQAEELADWFEEFDAAEATEIPVQEYLLERAARTRSQCERAVVKAVHDAVASGTPWSRVAEILGIDPIEAHDTYSVGIETTAAGPPVAHELVEGDDSGRSLNL